MPRHEKGPSVISLTFDLPQSMLFDGLETETLQEIARPLRRRSYSAGSTIFAEGDTADSILLVASGKAVRYRRDPEKGSEVTLSTSGPGDAFGFDSLIGDLRDVSARASMDAVCYEIHRADLRRLMLEYPQFAANLSVFVVRQLAEIENRVCAFSGRWSYGRLATALSQLAEREGIKEGRGLRIGRVVTQQDLANIIGASRETVSVQMKKLVKAGAVRLIGKTKGQTMVVFPEHLQQFLRASEGKSDH